jgi:hypothetical protein
VDRVAVKEKAVNAALLSLVMALGPATEPPARKEELIHAALLSLVMALAVVQRRAQLRKEVLRKAAVLKDLWRIVTTEGSLHRLWEKYSRGPSPGRHKEKP